MQWTRVKPSNTSAQWKTALKTLMVYQQGHCCTLLLFSHTANLSFTICTPHPFLSISSIRECSCWPRSVCHSEHKRFSLGRSDSMTGVYKQAYQAGMTPCPPPLPLLRGLLSHTDMDTVSNLSLTYPNPSSFSPTTHTLTHTYCGSKCPPSSPRSA